MVVFFFFPFLWNKRIAERGHYGDEKGENIPENHALERVVQALAMGAAEYSESDAETVVVFLVQAGETNAFDQRAVEHMLWEEYNVPVVRATHLQMLAHGRVDDAGVLFYEVTFAAVGFPVCFSSCYFGR